MIQQKKSNPLVSIITVVYNAVSLIEPTIESVIQQTYDNIEYIIIDGGSKDGTCELINKYKDKISYFLSEPDNGIYDAMNKGIKVSHGEWVNFMNAGDIFYNNEVIEDVMRFQVMSPLTKVLYGDVMIKFQNQKPILKSLSRVDKNNVQFSLNHQSTFIEGEWLRKQMYNTYYKIVADADFFNTTVKMGFEFKYVPVVISCYDSSDGVSSVNQINMFKEFSQIKGLKKWDLDWMRGYIRALLLRIIYSLPFGLGNFLISQYVKIRVGS